MASWNFSQQGITVGSAPSSPSWTITLTGAATETFTLTDLVITSLAPYVVEVVGEVGGNLLMNCVVGPAAPFVVTGLANGPQAYLGSYSGDGEISVYVTPPAWPGQSFTAYHSDPGVNIFIGGTS